MATVKSIPTITEDLNPFRIARQQFDTAAEKLELDAGMRDFLLPFLAKTKEDRKRLTLQDGFASLVLNAKSHASRLSSADLEVAT